MKSENFTDAIALLKADHRLVESLFEAFEASSGIDRKRKLAENICNELKVHTIIEEEIFYPMLKGKIDEKLLSEAYVEHDGAKVLINDILTSSPDEEFYAAKIKVLSEEIKHHVREEEEASVGMFAQCRKADLDLKAMRDQMLARKHELMPQAKTNSLPEATFTTINIPA